MSHWALLRKSAPSSSRLLNIRRISLSTSSSSGFGNGEKNRGRSHLKWFDAGSVCTGLVVVGSSLGLCNWYSNSEKGSILCFADSGQEIPELEKTTKYLFGDTYRRKVFFKYEKRIRMTSPPEKVFEYFASVKHNGEVLMTPADLMCAIVPVFPPSDSDRVREGSLQGEKTYGKLRCAPSKFFMLFDTDGDGLISFAEYIFFVTLLSIPESRFSVAFKMFDLDKNGEIDKEEFKKVMALMRTQNSQGARHRDGLRNGLKVSGSVEDGGVLEYFFGKDGTKSLKHESFVKFLRDLHDEITGLEFAHYDYKSRGYITAKDFALSMVASADMNDIDKFLDRVEEINEESGIKDIKITLREFKSFTELRKKVKILSMAMISYGTVNGDLTKADFKRAAEQVCEIKVSDNVVDMVFFVFDTNRDGTLSADEFIKVLQRRENNGSVQREAGFKGMLSCWMNCTNSDSD